MLQTLSITKKYIKKVGRNDEIVDEIQVHTGSRY